VTEIELWDTHLLSKVRNTVIIDIERSIVRKDKKLEKPKTSRRKATAFDALVRVKEKNIASAKLGLLLSRTPLILNF
jgi:hypothetical protein